MDIKDKQKNVDIRSNRYKLRSGSRYRALSDQILREASPPEDLASLNVRALGRRLDRVTELSAHLHERFRGQGVFRPVRALVGVQMPP